MSLVNLAVSWLDKPVPGGSESSRICAISFALRKYGMDEAKKRHHRDLEAISTLTSDEMLALYRETEFPHELLAVMSCMKEARKLRDHSKFISELTNYFNSPLGRPAEVMDLLILVTFGIPLQLELLNQAMKSDYFRNSFGGMTFARVGLDDWFSNQKHAVPEGYLVRHDCISIQE